MRILHNVNSTLLCTLIALATATPAAALQLDSETRQRIDDVFAEYDRTGGPGCAVGVVNAGDLVYARGYGMGQMDHEIPISERSVFYLASVSKQFAAAAVVIADHEGHLSLDDDIRRHIPEFPAYYQGTVTVRHLVHHTSGVRDYLSLLNLAGIPFDNILTYEAMVDLITRQKELNFAPGSEHLYSNSGYVLMAEIVKRATGRSLREYADEKIFGPLGMTSTHFHDDRTQIVRDRVFSYHPRDGGGWRTDYLINFDKVGDGGLYSTVEDLARWDRGLLRRRAGRPGLRGADVRARRAQQRRHDRLLAGAGRGTAAGTAPRIARRRPHGVPHDDRAVPGPAHVGDHALQRRDRQPGRTQHGGRGHRARGRVHRGGGRRATRRPGPPPAPRRKPPSRCRAMCWPGSWARTTRTRSVRRGRSRSTETRWCCTIRAANRRS